MSIGELSLRDEESGDSGTADGESNELRFEGVSVPELKSVEVILSGDAGHEEMFHVRHELRKGSRVRRKSEFGQASKSDLF